MRKWAYYLPHSGPEFGQARHSDLLQELYTVTEGISDERPLISIERDISGQHVSSRPEPLPEVGEIVDQKRRMRLLRRPERGLHAKMHLDQPALEPASASSRQCLWLADFFEPEERAIERSRLRFSPRGHRQLDVVYRKK